MPEFPLEILPELVLKGSRVFAPPLCLDLVYMCVECEYKDAGGRMKQQSCTNQLQVIDLDADAEIYMYAHNKYTGNEEERMKEKEREISHDSNAKSNQSILGERNEDPYDGQCV